jgi:glycosyltransferase involved in cell wall biosynthesis
VNQGWPASLQNDLAARRGPALFLTRNHHALARELALRFPHLEWTVLTKQDLRGWGPRRLLRALRARPWQVMVLEDASPELLRRKDLYRLLLLAARVRARWLVASHEETFTAEFVPGLRGWGSIAAALGEESWATLVAHLRAWGLVLRLRRAHPAAPPASGNRIALLKTEFWFNVRAGGSVSHALGVVNGMRALGLEPRLWSTSRLPLPPDVLEQNVIAPKSRPALLEDAAMAAFTPRFVSVVLPQLRAFRPSLIYHRHDVFSLAGLALARKLRVPLILEVNSSEVWVRRAWSRLTWRRLAEAMERVAFRNADRLILVSEELVPVVLRAGADRARVVVNPNGVDVSRFHPDDRGETVREPFPPDAVVCGFLGTFTRWHGVLFLAGQVAGLAKARPHLRFLFVGDGDMRPAVEERLARDGVAGAARFTGLIEPERVPEHLAACDILLSPHLPFEDGTPFFGSPTKLFEYLASGRPVVASRLGQIGRVVEHEETGLLFEPGDAEAFQAAVLRLVDHPEERRRMGERARQRAEERHTWVANVRRSLEGWLPTEERA